MRCPFKGGVYSRAVFQSKKLRKLPGCSSIAVVVRLQGLVHCLPADFHRIAWLFTWAQEMVNGCGLLVKLSAILGRHLIYFTRTFKFVACIRGAAFTATASIRGAAYIRGSIYVTSQRENFRPKCKMGNLSVQKNCLQFFPL